jgi:hypothetical protein
MQVALSIIRLVYHSDKEMTKSDRIAGIIQILCGFRSTGETRIHKN